MLGGSQVVDACGECGETVKYSTKCKEKNSLNPLDNCSVAAGIASGVWYLIDMAVLYFYFCKKKAANSHISNLAVVFHLHIFYICFSPLINDALNV